MTELIDTGAIYAFTVRDDANHAKARKHLERSLQRGAGFILLESVFAESMTLLKARVGADVAIRTGQALRDSASMSWMPTSPELERETWGVFQKYNDKEWSYVDCALLVAATSLRVSRIFGFDRHFLQMRGLVRTPS